MQTALITGGTSGIGLALAKTFAKNKFGLFLVARDDDQLQKTKTDLENTFGVKVEILAKDLSQKSSATEIFEFCRQNNIEIDVLVNNAGLGTYGFFAETEVDKTLNIVDVNIRSVTELTRLFLPQMLAKNNGKILNMASQTAFQPGPLWAVYAASKAYVLSFSLALRNELSGSGVCVTAVCPGSIKTNFQNVAIGLNESRLIKQGYQTSAEGVAEAAFLGLMQNKPYVVIGFINQIVVFFSKILPFSITTAAARWTLGK